MDFDKLNESILSGKNAEALKKLAEGKTGRSVADLINEKELLRAAKDGDSDTLSGMLNTILSTPQGRALVDEVKKAVKKQ